MRVLLCLVALTAILASAQTGFDFFEDALAGECASFSPIPNSEKWLFCHHVNMETCPKEKKACCCKLNFRYTENKCKPCEGHTFPEVPAEDLREALITTQIAKYAYAARSGDANGKTYFVAEMKKLGIEIDPKKIEIFNLPSGAAKESAFIVDAKEDGKDIRIMGFPGKYESFQKKTEIDSIYQDKVKLPGMDFEVAHGFFQRYLATKALKGFKDTLPFRATKDSTWEKFKHMIKDKVWETKRDKFFALSTIRIAGHSLGAAVAEMYGALFAYHMNQEKRPNIPKIILGTIGGPRVFAVASADVLQTWFTKTDKNPRGNAFWRIVNSQDPIPSLPLSEAYKVAKDKWVKHFGSAFYIMKGNAKWTMQPQAEDFSKFILGPHPENHGHPCDSYLKRLSIIQCQQKPECDYKKLPEDEVAEDWYAGHLNANTDEFGVRIAANARNEIFTAEDTNTSNVSFVSVALMAVVVAASLVWALSCRRGDKLEVDFEDGKEALMQQME